MIEVSTKEELRDAIKNKEKEILIINEDLAKNVKRFKKIKKLSKRILGVLLGAIGIVTIGFALAPLTGGSSAILSGVTTGALYSFTIGNITISTGAILAIGHLSILGSAVLFALWKDYNIEVEEMGPIKGLKLRKK